VFLACFGAVAVDAFATRHLLNEPAQDPKRYGVEFSNGDVSHFEVIQAAAASDKVYHNTCEAYTDDPDGWVCKATVENPHGYWWDRDGDATIKFQYFTTPGGKCGFVFRGTTHTYQWSSNTNGVFSSEFWDEWVHSGFENVFNGRNAGEGIVGDVSYYLYRAEADTECKNGVYFVGHSLGGAMATLADIFYEKKFNKKAVSITFGAPKLVVAEDNPKMINEMRIVHQFDPVAGNYGRYEHRGPGKEIRCEDGCDCKFIEVFDVGSKHAESNACSGEGYESKVYHKMYFYKKWVNAAVGPQRPPTPLKLIDAECTSDDQCHTGYCSCMVTSCQRKTWLREKRDWWCSR